jgi:phage terminase large subunit-like protein
MSSSFKSLATSKDDAHTDTNSFLKTLKGLDFAQWNKKVGLPVKPGRGELQFPFPYQWTIFNSLMQVENNEKDRHCAWLGSRGQGKTEFGIRFLSWLATRNDDLQGSEIMIITGSRASLSYTIISRIKHLMQEARLEDSAMSYVDINGVHIEGYPADATSGRGKPNVSAIFVDESSWWQTSETANVMDMVQGYFVKSNPYTLIASSPSQPGDLMDSVFKEPESETVWRRLKMDWKYAENLLYTQADLARIRKTSSWAREMELRWSSKAGSTFNQFDIERCKAVYDHNPTYGNERIISVDPASGTTGICVTEVRDGDICVLKAEEKIKETHESLSEYVYQLWHDYSPISKLYIDNSAVTFVKTMKGILGEPQEYMEEIKRYKTMHADYMLNCRCEPVFFTVQNKREMLGMLKQCMEEGHLKIGEV